MTLVIAIILVQKFYPSANWADYMVVCFIWFGHVLFHLDTARKK